MLIEPAYTVDNRLSFAQAAKENTFQMIHKKEIESRRVSNDGRDALEFESEGKFTFAP